MIDVETHIEMIISEPAFHNASGIQASLPLPCRQVGGRQAPYDRSKTNY
jgi:hypothetical protein